VSIIGVSIITLGFGMTETTLAVLNMAHSRKLKKGSVGLPLPNSDVQVRLYSSAGENIDLQVRCVDSTVENIDLQVRLCSSAGENIEGISTLSSSSCSIINLFLSSTLNCV